MSVPVEAVNTPMINGNTSAGRSCGALVGRVSPRGRGREGLFVRLGRGLLGGAS